MNLEEQKYADLARHAIENVDEETKAAHTAQVREILGFPRSFPRRLFDYVIMRLSGRTWREEVHLRIDRWMERHGHE
jgi:hypothetical protein